MTNRKRGLHSTSIVQHKQNIQISHGTKITLLKTQIHFIRKVSDRNSQAPDQHLFQGWALNTVISV